MVSSMTGLGVAEKKYENRTISVEIRSVNNRFLELSTRLPLSLSSYEQVVKEICRKSVTRGKLYVNISVQGEQNGYTKLKIAPETVRTVRELLESLKQESGVQEPLRLDHFLQYTEVFEPEIHDQNTEDIWQHVMEVLEQALKTLKEMRLFEGASLTQDIHQRLKLLHKTVNQVRRISDKNLPATHQRMVERIQKLVKDNAIDHDRLYTEISIIADKLDITEECVRLESHYKLFKEIIEKEEVVGKKLNFLLQEMNREVNTISSKANNAEISHLVVSMKEEIEKLREQVQNLE